MNFSNENVSPDNLPSLTAVHFHPLEDSYLKVKRINFLLFLIVCLILGFCAFYFIKKFQTPMAMYSTIAVFIFLAIIAWIGDGIGFRNSGYALRDKDILFRRGWIVRKVRVVPLSRVQHVSVQSGPVERKFGIASVSIFTAGSGSADFTINGITEEKAQQIKEWISNQLNGPANN